MHSKLTPSILPENHVRIARPSNDLAPLVHFYCEGLGLEILSEFHDHDGFDGVMLGIPGAAYHLEFTRHPHHQAGKSPSQDHLLVFYLPDETQWSSAIARMKAVGYLPVPSLNPYWDKQGMTFEDPDGYRVVLQHADWKP